LKETLNKVRYFLPAEKMQSNLAIFLSIFALFFAVGNSNVPCLSADTCAVGSDEVFSGTLTIQNNTNYGVKLTGNPTANRTITFPDADGTVKLAGATLTADKMLVSDTNGEVAVTDKYPFTLGTAGQFLKVSSSGLTMDFLTVGGLDSLTANAPYLSVDSLGVIDSSATLTASTPLKSSASGQITASDLDITTDITPGTALQEIRVNAGATALEYFTPSSSGGRWTLVGEGTAVNDNAFGTGTAIVCWYDNTQGTGIGGSVDQTKTYKLVLVPTNDPWYNPSLPSSVYPMANWKVSNTCVTGALSGFGASNTAGGQGYSSRGWHATGSNYQYNIQTFAYQQGTSNNGSTGSSQCGFSSFEIIFRNGKAITSSNTNNEGIKYNYESSAQCYQGSVPHAGQWQTGGGLAIMNNGDTSGENFDDVTGMYFVHYGDGTNLPKWYLYESDY